MIKNLWISNPSQEKMLYCINNGICHYLKKLLIDASINKEDKKNAIYNDLKKEFDIFIKDITKLNEVFSNTYISLDSSLNFYFEPKNKSSNLNDEQFSSPFWGLMCGSTIDPLIDMLDNYNIIDINININHRPITEAKTLSSTISEYFNKREIHTNFYGYLEHRLKSIDKILSKYLDLKGSLYIIFQVTCQAGKNHLLNQKVLSKVQDKNVLNNELKRTIDSLRNSGLYIDSIKSYFIFNKIRIRKDLLDV